MLRRIRFLIALLLAVCVLTSMAFSAPVMIGKITLNESPFELFGALHFPFVFNIQAPLLYVLCENGVSGGDSCVNNDISDFVCITNNSAGHGVAAMMSDLEASLSLGSIPADFPCSAGNSQLIFLPETGKPQVLSPKGGFPTIFNGAAGPQIKITAVSDLEGSTTTSDTLTVATQ